jgi:hypothetical protein
MDEYHCRIQMSDIVDVGYAGLNHVYTFGKNEGQLGLVDS